MFFNVNRDEQYRKTRRIFKIKIQNQNLSNIKITKIQPLTIWCGLKEFFFLLYEGRVFGFL